VSSTWGEKYRLFLFVESFPQKGLVDAYDDYHDVISRTQTNCIICCHAGENVTANNNKLSSANKKNLISNNNDIKKEELFEYKYIYKGTTYNIAWI